MKIIHAILVFNAGSSSIKFALYDKSNLALIFRGSLKDISNKPELRIFNNKDDLILLKNSIAVGYQSAIDSIYTYITENLNNVNIVAVGHRVVHGGIDFISPTLVTLSILRKLEQNIPLAPLHQQYNLKLIEAFSKLFPDVPHIACFDTEFHQTRPDVAKLFALPEEFKNNGIIKYGFHGISYEYIASTLRTNNNNHRAIVAHLGNGASLCAMKDFKSIETTMGFTTLDGLMMATRSGSIDPGVILYLLENGMTSRAISALLYNNSGLLGVSGISHDINELLNNDSRQARLAVEMFCYQTAKHIAALIPALGGLDILVFTAGIGENSALIRKKICDQLAWLELKLNNSANTNNHKNISTKDSRVEVLILPTNEEIIIAEKTYQFIKRKNLHAA